MKEEKERKEQEDKERKKNGQPPKKKAKRIAKHKKDIGSCKKIRLYPNEKERQNLNQWFGAVRWTYNQAIDALNNGLVDIRKDELRRHFVNACAFKQEGAMFGRLREK